MLKTESRNFIAPQSRAKIRTLKATSPSGELWTCVTVWWTLTHQNGRVFKGDWSEPHSSYPTLETKDKIWQRTSRATGQSHIPHIQPLKQRIRFGQRLTGPGCSCCTQLCGFNLGVLVTYSLAISAMMFKSSVCSRKKAGRILNYKTPSWHFLMCTMLHRMTSI